VSLIKCTPSTSFSMSRMHWQESLPISVHTLLHSPPLHYSKTSTGYPLSGEYISNWPPWRIRHCTLASQLTCPNCYNIMNQHGLCDLPLLLNSLSAYANPLMTTHFQHALILYRRRRFINHLLTYLITITTTTTTTTTSSSSSSPSSSLLLL